MAFAKLRSLPNSTSPSPTLEERVAPLPALTAEALREELGRFAVDVIRPEIAEATARLEVAFSEQLKGAHLHLPGLAKCQDEAASGITMPKHPKACGRSHFGGVLTGDVDGRHRISFQEEPFVDPLGMDWDDDPPPRRQAAWIGRLRDNMNKCSGATPFLALGNVSARKSRARATRSRATMLDAAARRSQARSFDVIASSDAPLSERQSLCGTTWVDDADDKHWARCDWQEADLADVHDDLQEWAPITFREFMLDIVEHPYFEFGCAGIIFANLLLIGFEADRTLKPLPDDVKSFCLNCDLIFCWIFLVELLIRICAYGDSFFHGDKRAWNIFDFVLVMLQVVDQVASRLDSKQYALNFSFLRCLRAVKNIRILRMVRMCRFITELRILLVVIGGSFRATFWTIFLLLLVTYSFSITIMVFIRSRMMSKAFDPEENEGVYEFYGSVPDTMWTLYMAISGGIEWYHPASVLYNQVSPMLRPFFGMYMAFMVFVFLNIITGIFLNTALTTTEDLKQHNIMGQIKRIFDEADEDKSGDICMAEFTNLMQDRELELYMRSLGWRAEQAQELFALLDADEDGTISVNEFMAGCQRLQGPVKAVDFASFANDIENAISRVLERVEHLERIMTKERKWAQPLLDSSGHQIQRQGTVNAGLA